KAAGNSDGKAAGNSDGKAAGKGDEAIEALVTALERDELMMAAKEALVRVGGRAVPSLAARLPDARLDRATLYVDLLRDIGDAAATPLLLDELARGRLAQEPLADALGAMLRAGDKRPMVDVVALLGAPPGSMRRHAAEAL